LTFHFSLPAFCQNLKIALRTAAFESFQHKMNGRGICLAGLGNRERSDRAAGAQNPALHIQYVERIQYVECRAVPSPKTKGCQGRRCALSSASECPFGLSINYLSSILVSRFPAFG
jgi:hypothetical protein